ncbi:MAG: hypothetical protein QMB42_01495 [SAR324 cluster bacterium]|jgi:hypothetical protein
MFFVNKKSIINHDYINVINSVYPILKDKIDNIIHSFDEDTDASNYYVDYFSEGHAEIHSLFGDQLSCDSINQLLVDLFLSVIRFDSKSSNYEVPELFQNYHAVHYFNNIKVLIARLDNNNMNSEEIINKLIIFEQNRHQNNECDCGKDHDLLRSDQLHNLFIQLLDYYYSVTKQYSKNNNIQMLDEYRYLN